MNKSQNTINKLTKVTEDEWIIAAEKCRKLIDYRTGRRVKFGCHSKKHLGTTPFDYYFDKAITKLYSGEWQWQDQYNFSEQVCRIVQSLISENVRKYKLAQKKESKSQPTQIPFDDVINFFGVDFAEKIKTQEKEEIYERQLNIITEAIRGKKDMELFFSYIKEGKNNDEICEATGWERRKLYKVTNQMKTRVKKYIAEQSKKLTT